MTPYERDPRTDVDVFRERLRLDRQIAPPLSPRGVRVARRLAAIGFALFLAFWIATILVAANAIGGPFAAFGYGAAVLLTLRLTWRATPAWIVVGMVALFVGSVVWLLVRLTAKGAGADSPGLFTHAALPLLMTSGLNAVLGTPPPTLRRLWQGGPYNATDI